MLEEENAPLPLSSFGLRPTHTCFNDALDLLVKLVPPPPEPMPDDIFLVHAICDAPDGSGPYSHAWVETEIDGEPYCMFELLLNEAGARAYFVTPKAEFYAEMAVQLDNCTRYTPDVAAALNIQTGNYGPWEARYAALCGRDDVIEAQKAQGR